MRLKKIKLAGFKSFVDPISLELKSPLMAIVGPNGCGKSNVIDAVRWVMGESSAKNLRGESSADVIFNGSGTRKPAGQASVELLFDNSDGSLGGEYAQFGEISIRRQASRDGQSTYFLNGTKCRRRDIVEIFLGTGLGPRSYAIIEQGMISHVIEAKPEELRSFLEEAAGISLYKKRRQETENRMRNTRENLDRLCDIKQEHEKQMDRLKRQAEAAEKYLHYKEDQKLVEVQLATIRWKSLDETGQQYKERIRSTEVVIEGKFAERAALDRQLDQTKLNHEEKLKAAQQVQNQYYECSNQISKIEQVLQNHRDRLQQLSVDLSQEGKLSQEIKAQMTSDQARMEQLKQELTRLEENYLKAAKFAEESEAVWKRAEESMQLWSHGWEAFQNQGNEIDRNMEVAKARLTYLDEQKIDIQNRIVRLEKEKADQNADPLSQEWEVLQKEISTEENKLNSGTKELQNILAVLQTEREKNQTRTQRLHEERSTLQALEGRRSSLETLQKVALGKTNQTIAKWLQDQALSEHKRLGEVIKVEEGFETAVEVVLANLLEALCIEKFETLVESAHSLQDNNIALFDVTKSTSSSVTAGRLNVPLLSSKVKSAVSLHTVLANVYVVDDLKTALNLRNQLKEGESCITKEGIWIGSNWIKIARAKEAHHGILERSQQLDTLQKEILVKSNEVENIETELRQGQALAHELELKQETLQNMQQNASKALRDLSTRANAVQAQLSYLKERSRLIEEELLGFRQQLESLAKDMGIEQLALERFSNSHSQYTEKRLLLQNERGTLRELLSKADNEMRLYKEEVHQLALKRQGLKTQSQSIEEGLSRLQHQLKGLADRHNTLQEESEKCEKLQQTVMVELNQLLAKRNEIETHVNHGRSAVEALLEEIRGLEKKRNALERMIEEEQNSLNALKLEWQGIEVRCQMGLDTITKSGFALEDLLKTLPEGINEEEWVKKAEQLENRIQRLGAINLAAIEEYQVESERKVYLDSQYQDLTEALQTLENAIRKIDKETRAQFRETFDKVNTEFRSLFPKLFGGGEAHLELTGDDLLEAGVTVMARPPGKRNSSIYQLSGGEKALVAVSLVFAIFRLNPAPFCLLDEVDAPLDDANVGRFCNLVKHMAETVQFIYITHNKLAMEMAHHLVGVTMKEAGVSRLVAVDVDAAVTLVAS